MQFNSIWLIDRALSGVTTWGHLLYSHLHHHSASQRHNIKDRRMNKRRIEDFFTIIFTSHFIARVRKGCSCERVLETEHKLHILTPTVMTITLCLSCFLRCSTRGLGVHSIGAFPRVPSVGCGFPYHIWSLTLWKSAGNCFGTLNSTKLNNNSTPTRSPTGSLKSNV